MIIEILAKFLEGGNKVDSDNNTISIEDTVTRDELTVITYK